MNDGEHAADHEREDRDGLGRARDGLAPGRAGEAQNRGDERAGLRDADPENEIDDVNSPEHRPLQACDAHSRVKLKTPCGEAGGAHQEGDYSREHVLAADARERPEQIFSNLTIGEKLRRGRHTGLSFL